MLEEPTVVQSEPAPSSTTHIVHALMQFLLAVRYRKNVVLVSLIVAGMLGGLYFATATRYYGATARVLVMGAGAQGVVSANPGGTRQRNLMFTFEKLFTSTSVVEGALQYLQREDLIDMAGVPKAARGGILQQGLSAEVVLGTSIIEVSYRSKDPQAAVSVVNAVIQSYREYLNETHKGAASEVFTLLMKEKDEHREKLDAEEERLRKAQLQARWLGIGAENGVRHPVIQEAFSLKNTLAEKQTERRELEASLLAIDKARREDGDLKQYALEMLDTVGRELLQGTLGVDDSDSLALAEAQKSLREHVTERKTKLMAGLGVANPDIMALDEQIASDQQFLVSYRPQLLQRLEEIERDKLGGMLVEMVRAKLDKLRAVESSLRQDYATVEEQAAARMVTLSEVDSIDGNVAWLKEYNKTLLDRLASVKMGHDGQEVRISVVQEPVESTSPVSPNLRRVAMMSLLGGLAAGLALVYMMDILDDRFRSVEEMQGHLDAPVLTMIRQLEPLEAEGVEALQIHVTPDAPECEALRTLRTALELADRDARQIVISSAEPGDGKTTVLANLAAAYAQSGRKTLLIDADLRRPGLTALMGMRGVDGLSGIIRGGDDVARMAAAHIRASGIEGLDMLASGPRPTNPAELLASARFSELLAWAETVYQQILIDSPPALATSDTAVIGRLVDGVVMVVQPDKNRRRLVTRAVQSLAALKIPLLGIAINRVGAENDRGYYGYNGGYSYGYGYAGEYGADPEEAEGEAEAPTVNHSEGPVVEFNRNAVPAAGIVPKRVA